MEREEYMRAALTLGEFSPDHVRELTKNDPGTPHLENVQAGAPDAQETAAEVDKEVMEILQKAYADAKRILTENRGLLDEISEFLLVKETITGDELMAYVNADKNALPAAEKTEE